MNYIITTFREWLVIAALSCMVGCAVSVTGSVEPGVNLHEYNSMYIVKSKEAEATTAIQNDLETRGFQVSSGTEEEIEKLDWAIKFGASTAMDLSTGGDIDGCREAIIKHSTVPIGMVPIYSMIIGHKLEDLNEKIILETLEHQCKQGIDYATIHAGVLKEHLPLIKNRLIGIVSRGGSLLAKWMLTEPEILLLDDPTRGIDVGTKHELYLLMREFVEAGGAVLFFSTEISELVHLADRVMVLYGGRVSATIPAHDISEQVIVRATLGGDSKVVGQMS